MSGESLMLECPYLGKNSLYGWRMNDLYIEKSHYTWGVARALNIIEPVVFKCEVGFMKSPTVVQKMRTFNITLLGEYRVV